jgi:hypothetical protein
MAVRVAIAFPSEAEALRKQAQAERRLTPVQRLQAVADVVAAAEALARAGNGWAAQREHQRRLEEEWRRRIKEFIAQHVAS